MEGLESKATLIRMTFVLVFSGEERQFGLDNMRTAAKELSQHGGPQNFYPGFSREKSNFLGVLVGGG